MKVLITGSTGFLGTALIGELLRDSSLEVLSLGRRSHPVYSSRISEKLHEDWSREPLLAALQELSPEAVVHCAAISSVGQCEKQTEEAQHFNHGVTAVLGEWCRDSGSYLCYVSTDLVFDGKKAPASGFTEADEPLQKTVYGKSKFLGEEGGPESGVILRSSLLYGPPLGGRPGPLNWMVEAFRSGSEVGLFLDEWRTPLFVGDLVEVIQIVLRDRPSGIYHCAGPRKLSRVEFGTKVAKRFNFSLDLIRSGFRSDAEDGHLRAEDVSLCAEKARSELGIQFSSPGEGLKKFELE